ncbi:FCD domain-containing protein [Bosea sp. (in: a-proteobacteria)]|uniref:FCD domain-containing protein n=1 Tax=Bosea sp. (in: a-proteobacteria) TaxID=1871050 RepID=UPI00260F1DC6|nr:FCD domain-containing protein [Bosea sp. (in: a-proteobacteria)]MCO5093158.1 FCD domain-containing protein [Bosea sp. (in: a-proteobacteria)]
MTNRTHSDRMALITLALLAESGQPIGARKLGEVFRGNGIDVAEATAGRYLSELDELGWTRSRGRQGRTLTAAGRDQLIQLRLREQLTEASALIAAAAEITRGEDLLEMLHARRAIEPEAARLAAARATREEIDGISRAADLCACSEGAGRVRYSRVFHGLLTRACHNRMLAAVAELLLETNERPGEKLEFHRRSDSTGASARLDQDHKDIVAALYDRDMAAAERLTREHIDRIIEIAGSASAPASARGRRPRLVAC